MAIEHNKDLHIELLRDELIMTREELDRKFRTHDAFKNIVNEVHSTVVMEELKGKAKSIMEDSLALDEYALIVWDANHRRFAVSDTKGMSQDTRNKAVAALDALIEPPENHVMQEDDHVYLPLSNGQTVYGALCVTNQAYRNAASRGGEVLDLTVNQLTKALGNAVLYETARQLCVTDDKTMIFNHRYLINRLDSEIKRAKRFGHQITCLMIDIDDFKEFNDSFGHLAGDDALSELASLINGTCRDIDIVARFGGEEFTVLLPETGVTGGSNAAERIIKTAAEFAFSAGPSQKASLTVSIGVASYPFHAEDGADLLKQADKALYHAKAAGKNQHQVAASAFLPEEDSIN